VALGCHAPGAIPKTEPRPPDDALAHKGEPCQVDDDCAGDKLVCDAGACIPWTRMAGPAPELAPQVLAERIAAGPVQIVDVRTGVEFRMSRIDGAQHVGIAKLAERLPELALDPAVPVVAICLTAHRSIPATRLLRRHGYDAVQLAGGMSAWRKAKLPRVGGPPDKPKRRGKSQD
jgi:rhodanese-related sulfurtransferase